MSDARQMTWWEYGAYVHQNQPEGDDEAEAPDAEMVERVFARHAARGLVTESVH